MNQLEYDEDTDYPSLDPKIEEAIEAHAKSLRSISDNDFNKGVAELIMLNNIGYIPDLIQEKEKEIEHLKSLLQ